MELAKRRTSRLSQETGVRGEDVSGAGGSCCWTFLRGNCLSCWGRCWRLEEFMGEERWGGIGYV